MRHGLRNRGHMGLQGYKTRIRFVVLFYFIKIIIWNLFLIKQNVETYVCEVLLENHILFNRGRMWLYLDSWRFWNWNYILTLKCKTQATRLCIPTQCVSVSVAVTSFWAALSFLLLFAYPTPEIPTPSFEYHTAFDGVAFGIVSNLHPFRNKIKLILCLIFNFFL